MVDSNGLACLCHKSQLIWQYLQLFRFMGRCQAVLTMRLGILQGCGREQVHLPSQLFIG